MEVKLAESAGFCFGVNRAMDKVSEQIEKADGSKKIYTYGPLIHNSEVVKDLQEKGVDIIESAEDLEKIRGQILVIRSHGVARHIYEKAREYDITIVDATCPFVTKIHEIVQSKGIEGYHVIVIGDRTHPEVEGITGWATGPVTVINTEEEAKNFSCINDAKICIVSQTTFNASKFKHFVEIINKTVYDTLIINTICNATAVRQNEAADISMHADKMIVIGDTRSSNTKKLVEICRANCKDTYHIQTVRDLTGTDLQSGTCVGITAGASTPNHLIQEVLLYVRGI